MQLGYQQKRGSDPVEVIARQLNLYQQASINISTQIQEYQH